MHTTCSHYPRLTTRQASFFFFICPALVVCCLLLVRGNQETQAYVCSHVDCLIMPILHMRRTRESDHYFSLFRFLDLSKKPLPPPILVAIFIHSADSVDFKDLLSRVGTRVLVISPSWCCDDQSSNSIQIFRDVEQDRC